MTIRQVIEIIINIDHINPLETAHQDRSIILRQSTLWALRKFLEECVIRGKIDE